MSFLKLVGGTDFKPTAIKDAPQRAVKTKRQTSKKGPALTEVMARKIINGLVIPEEGKTVKQLFAEYNLKYPEVNEIDTDLARRLMTIDSYMRRMGVQIVPAEIEDDLDVCAYGKVISPKQLMKSYPELKPNIDVYVGLEF